MTSKLDLTIEINRTTLTPAPENELSLESLLKGSPKECFSVTEEDRAWIDARPLEMRFSLNH